VGLLGELDLRDATDVVELLALDRIDAGVVR
jgi:hypothetical protein